MKKSLPFALLAAGLLSGCVDSGGYANNGYSSNPYNTSRPNTTAGIDNNTLVGAGVGAAAGSILSDDNRVAGALVGGAVGAAAGNYLGRSDANTCAYENAYGERYTAPC